MNVGFDNPLGVPVLAPRNAVKFHEAPRCVLRGEPLTPLIGLNEERKTFSGELISDISLTYHFCPFSPPKVLSFQLSPGPYTVDNLDVRPAVLTLVN